MSYLKLEGQPVPCVRNPKQPKQNGPYAALWQWGSTPFGRITVKTLQQHLLEALPLDKSALWLQCGALESEEARFTEMVCRTKIVFSEERLPNTRLFCSPKHIALARESVDVIFFPFSLHIEQDYHAVLAEADRALRPEGFLIIAGMNPISFIGAQTCWGGRHPMYPHQVFLHNPWKIAQIMRRFDYTSLCCRYWEFRPPYNARHFLRTTRWLNFVGSILAPWPPQFYLLIYQKKTVTPSLIGLEPWSVAELRSVF